MRTAKNYFQDRLVLLLLSVNVFLAFLGMLSVLLRLQGGGSGFIVQYRATLGISAFKTGSATDLISFVGFVLLVLVAHATLSWRTYHIRRQLSVIILSLGALLLLLAIIISNALLVLR